jgi:hypothetical protein
MPPGSREKLNQEGRAGPNRKKQAQKAHEVRFDRD